MNSQQFFSSVIEIRLMEYCIKIKGNWLDKILFFFGMYRTHIKILYEELRSQDLIVVFQVLENGGPNYKKFIDEYNEKYKDIIKRWDKKSSKESMYGDL